MDHSLLSYRTSTVRILKLRAGLRQAIHDSPPTFSMRSWDWLRGIAITQLFLWFIVIVLILFLEQQPCHYVIVRSPLMA